MSIILKTEKKNWSSRFIYLIMYIMLCGYPPFNGETDQDIIEAVKKGKFSFPEDEWEDISESAKDLIKKCLMKSYR